MSTTRPNKIPLPPRRTFGPNDSALDDDESPQPGHVSAARRVLGRISFGSSTRKPSFSTRPHTVVEEEAGLVTPSERPPIPSALQPSGEAYTTPLPALSMIVLSIIMLSEFLSANVSVPFLLFMVKGFGEVADEADVAFWAGILVSTFFMTQFLTSLLWATVAEKHGRRAVLVISLLGSSLTCLAFGTSTSLRQAIAIRLLQGIFAGAVGVARGSVAFVTDATNEGRAYAILGFCWGLGGVTGAIIGGSFERPAVKWPSVFQDIRLFVDYPYLLPCGVAAAVTLTGSILACFLGPDGGPRQGAIRLLPEKINTVNPAAADESSAPSSPIFDEPEPRGVVGSLRKKVSQKLSGYFAQRVHDAHSPSNSAGSTDPPVPMSSPSLGVDRLRPNRDSGSAYGYTGAYRNRLASNATTLNARRNSIAHSVRRRRAYTFDVSRDPATTEPGDLNFAQRLLMANENAVTNIADLWVAAAMNVDNEDPFESDTEADSDADSLELGHHVGGDDNENRSAAPSTPTGVRRGSQSGSITQSPSTPKMSRRISNSNIAYRLQSQHGSPRLLAAGPQQSPNRRLSISQSIDGNSGARRFSTTVPSIFAHPGVKTPTAVLDAQELLARTELQTPTGAADPLAPILESRQPSEGDNQSDVEPQREKPPSLASQLPIQIIMQYGLLALHSTTHDQVFMSYLVTDYEAGGLNLNAGHFAQLIALMCLAQIAYQFYLYPNMGPPRGRFSHLAMFRIGSLLFIPSYLTVVLYRPFASAEDDGNFIVMTGLAISTAVRYCAITFGYTAISILLNYMTPPNAVGYANGIAQSIVSLARCFGPVIGGWLWSISVQDNPSGYPLGFIVCAGVCALTVAQSFMIR